MFRIFFVDKNYMVIYRFNEILFNSSESFVARFRRIKPLALSSSDAPDIALLPSSRRLEIVKRYCFQHMFVTGHVPVWHV